MSVTDWKFPGATHTIANQATQPWTNTNNVKADDGTVASQSTSKFSGSDEHDGPELITYDYGFNIPTGSSIVGIECQLEGRETSIGMNQLVYLHQGGSPNNFIGTSKRNDWDMTGTTEIFTFGSAIDTWGASLTPTDINDTTFGWTFMPYDAAAPVQSELDYMRMRIHYLQAGEGTSIMLGNNF